MTDPLAKARELVQQQKYKKALPLLKKLNQKHPSFPSLELEGFCLHHNKQYPMAVIKLEQALKLAPGIEDKHRTLINQVASLIEAKQLKQAAEKLQAALELNDGPQQAGHRNSLCNIYQQLQDYPALIEQAHKLLNSQQYSHKAMLYLTYGYHHAGDKDKSLTYLTKLRGELSYLPSELVSELLKAAIYTQPKVYCDKLFNELEPKYGHSNWFRHLGILAKEKFTGSKNTKQLKAPKTQVVGSNQHIVDLVIRLLTQLKEQGASISPKVQIIEQNDELSVNAFVEPLKDETLLHVPLVCMPLISDYQFAVDEHDQLLVTPKAQQINPQANAIMETIRQIYNATHKLQNWRERTPFLALAKHKALLDRLIQPKNRNWRIHLQNNLLEQNKLDELLIESFLGSRIFSYKQAALKKAGIQTCNQVEPGLLTVIDFLNHKMDALGYQEISASSPGVAIKSAPEGLNGELFVQYNLDDPAITFLIYGFVDANAPWLFSIPCEFNLPSGVQISIGGIMGVAQLHEIPEQLKDCRTYFPANIGRKGNQLLFSNMVIPKSENAQALRRVLSYCLVKQDVEKRYQVPNVLDKDLNHLESQLVNINQHYWQEIQQLTDSASALPDYMQSQLETLTHFCLKHIQAYKQAQGIL